MKTFPINIFVFGSNEAGRHGKGAALAARLHHGAIYGQGYGLQGQSFAIPTKDKQLKPLPLNKIKIYIDQFKSFANDHPEYIFNITRVGCGLAGYSPQDIEPLFTNLPKNCNLPNW